MLLETIDAREPPGRQELTVNAQIDEALVVRPLGEIRIDTLAIDHQRREQDDVPAAEVAHDARGNGIGALGLDRYPAIGTMLRAELDEQQAQKMMDLRQSADRALAPTAAGALLNGHRRRNAVDGIDIRTRCNLHELPRVRVQGFQIATLALAEHDVERQR